MNRVHPAVGNLDITSRVPLARARAEAHEEFLQTQNPVMLYLSRVLDVVDRAVRGSEMSIQALVGEMCRASGMTPERGALISYEACRDSD